MPTPTQPGQPQPLAGVTALVTGGSRGIGAATARLLAERGADVAINYRSKQPRAEQVADTITALGRRALTLQADLTSHVQTAAMFTDLATAFGKLEILVLNASGGLEPDRDPGYAMALNHTAQLRTLDLAIPLLPPGGRVVFVTSHAAHFYGTRPVIPAYEPVAASKHAGETALRARIPELADHGLTLVAVSGDIVEGTITPKLLERAQPGLLAARRAESGGRLPGVEEFAAAVVDAATDQELPAGATIYVGSTD